MQTFSTFDFYKNTYGGKLSESKYNRDVPDAYQEIMNSTYGAAANAPESMQDQLSRCECEIVDAISAFSQSPVGSGAISSISNDGFSISYGSRYGDSGASSEASVYLSICRRWLRRPLNLMSRVIQTNCDS